MKRSLLLAAGLLLCALSQSQEKFQFNESANRFVGHRTSVGNLSYSPDGKILATVGGKNQAIIFDANTGEIISKSPEYDMPMNWTAMNKDGDMLAMGSWGKSDLIILDPMTGKEINKIPLEGGVFGLDFSPVSNDLAVLGTVQQKQTIAIYDVTTGERKKEIFKEGSDKTFPTTICYSPNGQNIACGISNVNQGIRIYDVINGYLLETFKHSDDITNIDYSPDGTKIVGGGTDKNVYIWDAKTGTKLQTLTGYDGYVSTVDFSPDGNKVVAAGMGRGHRFMMWDANSGSLLQDVDGRGADVNCLEFSPDGLSMAMALQTYGDAFDVATVLIYQTGEAVNAAPWYTYTANGASLEFPKEPTVALKSDSYYAYTDVDLTDGYFVYGYYGVAYKIPVNDAKREKAETDRADYYIKSADTHTKTTFSLAGETGIDLITYRGTARTHYRIIFVGDVLHQWSFGARNKDSCPEEDRIINSFKVSGSSNSVSSSTSGSTSSTNNSTSNNSGAGSFKLNDKVMANWQNKGKYWPGKITRISNGKYYVEYDDSGVEWCTLDQLKPANYKPSSSSTTSSSDKLKIGDRVQGNWKGQGKWYPGKLAKIAGGKYYIEYDDGDVEWVTADKIKKG